MILRTILALACIPVAVAFAACGGPSEFWVDGEVDPFCRENAVECEGDIGGICDTTDDCFDGTCCHDKNCGDGTCTYRCDGDSECPVGMACEHHYCFFECDDDNDCGAGQKCEHGKTICEYEGGD
ncbi:MAG: hypothetical protein HOW73_43785 [Polyangiaceae bacterium]|nr:hypothetical protein [Polyangiaceae bacterium]